LIADKESPMKNPLEVLRQKEQEILRVKQEIEALRITAKLIGEELPSTSEGRVEFRQVVKMP
jgi:ribosomal protein S3